MRWIGGVEHRVHKFKRCKIQGCDHRVVSSWYVGGPHYIKEVPIETQEVAAQLHLEAVHSGPLTKTFT